MPQDGHQHWIILENIGRFEKRWASETKRDQRDILVKLLALERDKLIVAL